MRKIFTYFMLCFIFALVSCEDDKTDGNTEDPNYVFTVAEQDKTVTSKAIGETKLITVKSTKNGSSVAYEVQSHPDWVEATVDLTGLTLKFDENTLKEQFTGEVVLKQGETGTLLTLNVALEAVTASVSLDASVSTPRLKILMLKPEVSGYSDNTQYLWEMKVEGQENVTLGTNKDLAFIKMEPGTYNLKFSLTDGNLTDGAETTVSVTQETTTYSPYLSKVIEYKPAPMRASHGLAFSEQNGKTYTIALQSAEDRIKGVDYSNSNLGVSLGSLGGYIVFKFDHTILNIDGRRDFRIGSYATASAYPAPGIVYVAFDANGNGEPDEDEWYELAGSEYGKTNNRYVKVAYDRPNPILDNTTFTSEVSNYVTYTVNTSESGVFSSGSSPYLLPQWPLWLSQESEGAKITFNNAAMIASNTAFAEGAMYPSATVWYNYGYANNNGRDQTQSSFDINWAVDKNGKSVHLPGIDFIKVQTATLQYLGAFYGPASTLINCAIDLHLKNIEVPTINRN